MMTPIRETGRHQGWYPVAMPCGPEKRLSYPTCMWWSGTGWRLWPGETDLGERADRGIAVVGPRIDMSEVW